MATKKRVLRKSKKKKMDLEPKRVKCRDLEYVFHVKGSFHYWVGLDSYWFIEKSLVYVQNVISCFENVWSFKQVLKIKFCNKYVNFLYVVD